MRSSGSFSRITTWSMVSAILLTFSSCMYSSRAQKKMFSKIENKQFDVVIVPGLPFQNGQWDRIMRGRVYWSKYLYDKGIAKNIIYSGAAVYSPYYEGKIMAMYAAAIGIPPEHIFLETKAEHSTENIYYSYQKAKKMSFKTFALASDPFQTKLLRRYIRKKIDPAMAVIPFVTDTLRVLEPVMVNPPIDYEKAFKKDFISIKKRESFWKRWRGTRGKNVDMNAESP